MAKSKKQAAGSAHAETYRQDSLPEGPRPARTPSLGRLRATSIWNNFRLRPKPPCCRFMGLARTPSPSSERRSRRWNSPSLPPM